MSTVEIRDLTPDDRLAHRRLMAHAFGKGRVVAPPTDDEEAKPEDRTGQYGLFENGELRAALTSLPFLVHWGPDVTLGMGGVAGVATFAESRGLGYVDQLLKHSLRKMRETGQPISALYPFQWSFYRRHGWDWVGEKREIKLPLRDLKSAPEGRKVTHRFAAEADETRAQLEPAYTAFARRYRGLNTAETHRWAGKLEHSGDRTTYPYVYEPTGAYLLWRYGDNGGHVREFVASSAEEYRALLSLLHYLETQNSTARLTLPPDSPLQSFVMSWDLNTEVRPVFMGRVADVEAAMRALDAAGVPNGSVTVAIKDEQAPWNDGVWRFTVEAGKVLPSLTVGASAGDADVTADIRAFSQAFWGKPSLDDLRAAGRVEVASEDGYRLLSRLLPPAHVYTLDDF